MAKELVLYPDPLLKSVSNVVTDFDYARKVANEMIEVLKASETGIGLAAVQIGEPIKLIVVRQKIGDNINWQPFVNPVINGVSMGLVNGVEGCLSYPEIFVRINRYTNIGLSYQDLEGNTHSDQFLGLEARIIQHEVDHLNGISFLSNIPDDVRIKIQPQLTKLKKTFNSTARIGV